MMKKMVSIMALIMTAIMLLSGCGGVNRAAAPEAPTGSGGRKVLDVSFMYWNIPAEEDQMFEDFQEMFDVKLSYITATNADYYEKLGLLAATNELPDFFMANAWNDRPFFFKLINEGMVRDVPQKMIDKYEQARKTFEVNWMYKYEDKWYYWPKLDRNDWAFSNSLHYIVRSDYMKNLGLQQPETWDDFTNLLYAMANDDPDGNGIKDTYGITWEAYYMIDSLVYFFFQGSGWVYTDGKWQLGLFTEGGKQATKWMRQLYQDGVIEPEYVLFDLKANEKFTLGQVAVTPYSNNITNMIWGRQTVFDLIKPDSPTDDYIDVLKMPSSPSGKKFWQAATGATGGGNMFSSKVDDEKMERLAEIHNFLSTPEGYARVYYGIEGEHYELNPNGTLTSLLPENANGEVAFIRHFPWGDRFRQLVFWNNNGVSTIRNPNATDWDIELYKRGQEWYTPSALKNTSWVGYTPIEELVEFALEEYGEDRVTEIVVSNNDFDSMWEKFVSDAYANKPIQVVTDAVNAAAAANNIDPADYMP